MSSQKQTTVSEAQEATLSEAQEINGSGAEPPVSEAPSTTSEDQQSRKFEAQPTSSEAQPICPEAEPTLSESDFSVYNNTMDQRVDDMSVTTETTICENYSDSELHLNTEEGTGSRSRSRSSLSNIDVLDAFHPTELKDENTIMYDAERAIRRNSCARKISLRGDDHTGTLYKSISKGVPSDSEQTDSTDKLGTMGRKISTTRTWIVLMIILIFYLSTIISLVPLCTQYFPVRIAEDKYNITVNESDTSGSCANHSNSEESQINEVQSEAANIILMATITGGIPAMVMCLFVGSYADYLGRRPLVLVSLLGLFFRVGSLGIICAFDAPIYLYLAGSALDGLGGSLYTMILAVSAIITDLTPDIKSRIVKFAVVEGIVMVSGALAQILVGFLIREVGFLVPILGFTCLLLLALLMAIFGLPETMPVRRTMNWNILQHMRKVFGFYFLDGTRVRRLHFIIGLLLFSTINITMLGRQNVETLFMLNSPICWSSVEIGIFNSIRLILMSSVAVVTIQLLKRRVSFEVIGLVAIVSGIAGFIFESMATDTVTMYLSALVALLYMTVVPIPRTLLSQIASPIEQGALFSSFSVIEVLANLVSSTMATVIYNYTLDVFKGAVFVGFAVVLVISFFLLLSYRLLRRAHPYITEHVISVPDMEREVNQTSEKDKTSQYDNDIPSESTHLLKHQE